MQKSAPMTATSGASVCEEWKPITGFQSYEVSSHGRVRRVVGGRGAQIGRILRPKRHRHGYAIYDLSQNDLVTRMTAARAIALAFHGLPPSDKHQAAHGDGDPTNDVVWNIRWATPKENAADADLHGRRRRGDRHQNSKLSDASVRRLRKRRKEGATFQALALEFGVSVSNAFEANEGKRQWGHL